MIDGAQFFMIIKKRILGHGWGFGPRRGDIIRGRDPIGSVTQLDSLVLSDCCSW